jgi:hypothetical protein
MAAPANPAVPEVVRLINAGSRQGVATSIILRKTPVPRHLKNGDQIKIIWNLCPLPLLKIL